jgi:hypothetical protein
MMLVLQHMRFTEAPRLHSTSFARDHAGHRVMAWGCVDRLVKDALVGGFVARVLPTSFAADAAHL